MRRVFCSKAGNGCLTLRTGETLKYFYDLMESLNEIIFHLRCQNESLVAVNRTLYQKESEHDRSVGSNKDRILRMRTLSLFQLRVYLIPQIEPTCQL